MKRALRNTFFCGTSNIVLPVPNKQHFPEEYREKSRLNYYASLFNTLEVNSSFYKMPMARTVEKWADDVPGDFKFTFKLWRGITHNKDLVYGSADVQRFLEVTHAAGVKKGCLLIQFPAGIKVSLFHKVKGLLDEISSSGKAAGWRLAVEFRDPSWYCDEAYELLETYSAAVVIHDMPRSVTPLNSMDTDFVYVRFHGEKGDYKGSYADSYLHEYAGYIRNWEKEGKTVFAYFNNTIGDAVHNALKLAGYHSEH